jgi:adenine C2-methylase RlmN of 23S rRNA A2503 and tRNA A37
MKLMRAKKFANGIVYALSLEDGFPVEVTDTFLPFYTKDAIGRNQNTLDTYNLGDRSERWMIGVSCMSGCPVHCKFCATGSLKKWRNLTAQEIVAQVDFIVENNPDFSPWKAREFKINYTRMGEPFLNLDNVRQAIEVIDKKYTLGNKKPHHYLSTIGVQGSDFAWIKDNITLQVSLHSLEAERRNWLIPYKNKFTIQELGQIRTLSHQKTTVNLTLVEQEDFDIEALKLHFDPACFFIKLSPINPNPVSERYELGAGVIESTNLV